MIRNIQTHIKIDQAGLYKLKNACTKVEKFCRAMRACGVTAEQAAQAMRDAAAVIKKHQPTFQQAAENHNKAIQRIRNIHGNGKTKNS